MPNVLSAILLDLDGTLVDSAPQLAEAVNGALRPLGRRMLALEEVRGMIGQGLPALTRAALAATGGDPGEAAFDAILGEVRAIYDRLPPPEVYDGVRESLGLWHGAGLRLVICTNKPEGSARRLLAELDLDRYIARLAGGDSYPRRKPHPDHLLRPLEDLGIDPASAVMVGDSGIDARAARDARIPFIVVTYGYSREGPEELGAAAAVDRFGDVGGAIHQVAADRGLAFPPAAPAV